ncbi:unnamed protein product [Orchesella dallaii]|uniref:Uncharacterized protein n=1 Tax=Orchesella dallaii TaxID=48710 RepID=A0ABP1Q316_9HEXA
MEVKYNQNAIRVWKLRQTEQVSSCFKFFKVKHKTKFAMTILLIFAVGFPLLNIRIAQGHGGHLCYNCKTCDWPPNKLACPPHRKCMENTSDDGTFRGNVRTRKNHTDPDENSAVAFVGIDLDQLQMFNYHHSVPRNLKICVCDTDLSSSSASSIDIHLQTATAHTFLTVIISVCRLL